MPDTEQRCAKSSTTGIFWKSLWRPFKELVRRENLSATVLWFIFTIFAAQMGTIVNIIKHVIFHDGQEAPKDFNFWTSIQETLYLDSRSGSFYTFAIVLIASVLSPLFIGLIQERDLHFKRMKVYAIVVTIFTLFFGGVFYSFSTLKTNSYAALNGMQFCVDKSQLFFFVIAIAVSLYAFSLTRMDKEKNRDIDDYDFLNDEHKRREELTEEIKRSSVNGIKLQDHE